MLSSPLLPAAEALEKAASVLAETAITGQESRRLRKEAKLPDALQGLLSHLQGAAGGIGEWAKANPELAATLGGAGVGAGLGGVSSVLGRRRGEQRSLLRDMSTGALGGAALGGGGALAARHLPAGFWNRAQGPSEAGKGPSGAPGGVQGASGGPNAVKLKPEALANPQGVLDQIQTSEHPSWLTRGVDFAGDAYSNFLRNHPYLAGAAGLDAAATATGTANNLWHKRKGNTFVPRSGDFVRGAVGEIENPNTPSDLKERYQRVFGNRENVERQFDQIAEKVRTAKPEEMFTFGPAGFTSPMTDLSGKTVPNPDTVDLTAQEIKDWTRRGKPTVQWGFPGASSAARSTAGAIDKGVQKVLGKTRAGAPRFTGTPLTSLARKIESFNNPLHEWKGGWRGAARVAGPRAALYAGIPLATEAVNQYNQDLEKRKALNLILQNAVQ